LKGKVDIGIHVLVWCRRHCAAAAAACVALQPEYWPTGIGGWASGSWKPGFDAYVAWFDKVALQLNPCGQRKRISGPGWGARSMTKQRVVIVYGWLYDSWISGPGWGACSRWMLLTEQQVVVVEWLLYDSWIL
jgi:hypothetical protein